MYFGRCDAAPLKVTGFAAALLVTCAVGLIALFIGWGFLNSFSLTLFGLST